MTDARSNSMPLMKKRAQLRLRSRPIVFGTSGFTGALVLDLRLAEQPFVL